MVRAFNEFVASERARENDQRRFRKVEVREHDVDRFEAVRRANKEIGLTSERSQFKIVIAGGVDRSVGSRVASGLQRTHGRGSDRDDASSARLAIFDRTHDVLRDGRELRMHMMLREFRRRNRFERAGSDVERYRTDSDA